MEEKVLSLIKKQFNINSEINLNDSFIESLSFDSLQKIELIMKIEEEFNIKISANRQEKILTINDLVLYIKQKTVKR